MLVQVCSMPQGVQCQLSAQHAFTNMQLLVVYVAKTGSEVTVFEKRSNQSLSYTFSCTDNTMDK